MSEDENSGAAQIRTLAIGEGDSAQKASSTSAFAALPWASLASFGLGGGGEVEERTETSQSGGTKPILRRRGSMSFCEFDPVEVGCATLISILPEREQKSLHVDTSSVYGGIVAMPQFARTARWPTSMTRLVVRAMIFLALNVVVQGSVLYLITKEEYVMDRFAGQMNLCDFGAHLWQCPQGGEACLGPGGTAISPHRMYDYSTWATRNYVKAALKDIFPDKAAEIDKHVDPGEYGVESWFCRVLCVFLLMMALYKDLQGTLNLIRLLYHIPTANEPWIKYRHPEWAPDRDYAKTVHNCEELDFVELKICGMPYRWKMINLFFVALPKFMLWKLTAECGTNFLMETSSIEDVIINSMALTFVLNIDELICDTLMTDNAKYMLSKLQPFPLWNVEEEEKMTQEDALMRLRKEVDEPFWQHLDVLFPVRLIVITSLAAWFIFVYYLGHCDFQAGRWVSQSVHFPKSTNVLGFASTLFPSIFHIETEDEPYWEMPTWHPES